MDNATLLRTLKEIQENNRKMHNDQQIILAKAKDENERLLKANYIMLQEVIRLQLKVKNVKAYKKLKEDRMESLMRTANMDEIVKLPCETPEALLALEDKVKEDTTVAEYIRLKINPIFPGTSVFAYIKAVLKILMTSQCIMGVSYSGRSDTYRFKEFEITRMILEALASHFKTEKAENIFVENFTKVREATRNSKHYKKLEAVSQAESSSPEDDTIEYIDYDNLDSEFIETIGIKQNN